MKLFASDYDGTLRIAADVATKDKEAIHQWRKQGNKFVIVTGRSMESIQHEILRQDLEVDLIVANNGGVVYDQTFEPLKTTYIPFEKAAVLVEHAKTMPISSFVVNDGFYRAKQVVDETKEDKKYGHVQGSKTMDEVMQEKKIAQIVLALHDEQVAEDLVHAINKQYAGYVQAYRNVSCIDIAPSGVSKADGIAFASTYFQMPQDAIYAIGDSYNDQPMLKATYGFALHHAPDAVKNDAQECCEDVAEAIQRIMEQESE